MKRCAVCWPIPGTTLKGRVDSLYLCERCRTTRANRGWTIGSKLEAGGWDMDEFQAGTSIDAAPRRDSYAGKLAIQIMRLHCDGLSNRAIARKLDCNRTYVNRTVLYWKKNRREKLNIIKRIARLSDE